MKNFKVAYYIAALFVIGLVALFLLTSGSAEKTVPKIKLSYFKSEIETAQSIHKILQQEIKNQNYFWLGIEPEKNNQISIAVNLKKIIESEIGPFDLIFLDKELGLNADQLSQWGNAQIIPVKSDWYKVADLIKSQVSKRILVVTAAIYSTNLIQQNPVHKINEVTIGVKPLTISMGYFAVDTEDEKNNLFHCLTDDKEGVASWGCAVLNKARSQRRKLSMEKIKSNPPLIPGLMDLTGEKDYMLLIK